MVELNGVYPHGLWKIIDNLHCFILKGIVSYLRYPLIPPSP